MKLEQLESRDAPAVFFSYTDADGDKVKLTLSAGTIQATGKMAGSGEVLALLDLRGAAPGASLSMSVTRAERGDGLANVGFIDATGVDLGRVTIKGDLGGIDCGDGDPARPALRALNVRSMGCFGATTQGPNPDFQSDIFGALGALNVSGDVKNVSVSVADGMDGTVGSVTIGGSLIGGADFVSGTIFSIGNMGPVMIGGSVIGGSGQASGQVGSGYGQVGPVTVGGSLIGGSGYQSGLIAGATGLGSVTIGGDLVGGSHYETGVVKLFGTAGKIGNINIAGSIFGGAGLYSGGVFSSRPDIQPATTALNSVSVGGSVFGGPGDWSGSIFSFTGAGSIRVRGDVIGGAGQESGHVQGYGSTKSISIGGSLVGGSGDESGQIDVGDVNGPITIGGSIRGGTAKYTGVIYASDVAGNVTVKGSVIGGSLATGAASSLGAIFVDDAGAICIGGDLVGGSISGDAGLSYVGMIDAENVGSITVGGSVISGTDNSSGTLFHSGSIEATTIGTLAIKGSLIGNLSKSVSIQVNGASASSPGLALGRLSVGGNVEDAVIEVGYYSSDLNGTIGKVIVGGDWIASSLASGVSSANLTYGDADDSLIAGTTSRIASISIGGDIIGLGVVGASFAFTAREIGAFRVGGVTLPRTSGVDPTVYLSPETGRDVMVREL